MLGTRVVAGMLAATRVATQERTGAATRPTAGTRADRSASAVGVSIVRPLVYAACATYVQPSYCCLCSLCAAQQRVQMTWSLVR
jgi:hypothetical protein